MVLLLFPAEGEMHIARFCGWRVVVFVVFLFLCLAGCKVQAQVQTQCGLCNCLIANTKSNNGLKKRDKKTTVIHFASCFAYFFPCLSTIRHR
ncbi:hypothetical protein F5H01DRAFT_357166 [Linnemannia elongata]|nr:hypothetical protein F5H01DRAFT_357166 [Linnemannia elongata]